MRIVYSRRKLPGSVRRTVGDLVRKAVWLTPIAALGISCGVASADPMLPSIGASVYDLGVTNPNYSGIISTSNTAAQNTTALNNAITYASAHGGGTVEVPAAASPYLANIFSLRSGVDLQVDTGATIRSNTTTNGLITTSGTGLHDIAITGGGTIDGNATSTGNNLINLNNISRLLVQGVNITNSPQVHLVAENDSNVTINGINIADPNGYITNGDGIDYAGSHFLIENSSVDDGDDDIVAKPESTFCNDITITGCTILGGHGISIGGQTNAGLNGLTVNNCTFNGTTNAIRFKAGRGNGGVVQNISFNNITVSNVSQDIVIMSYYVNGGSAYPLNNGTTTSIHGSTPGTEPNATYNTFTTPLWKNISFSNVTTTNSGISDIYGLPEAPIQGLSFINCNFGDGSKFELNYAGYNGTFDPNATPDPNYEVQFVNSSFLGIPLTQDQLAAGTIFQTPPNGLFDVAAVLSVPEPTSALALAGMVPIIMRRRKRPPPAV